MKPLFLVLIASCTVLAAQPDNKRNATDELLEVTHFENTAVDSAVTAFDGFTKQMIAQGVPAAAIGEIRDEARKMYNRIFRTRELRAKIKELYNKTFSEAEIEELIAFYRTPLGQKTLAATPSIMSESMQLAMTAIQKEMPEFQQKVADIVQKHQKAEELPEEKSGE